jgi:hypothetical protein
MITKDLKAKDMRFNEVKKMDWKDDLKGKKIKKTM